jgi:iron(III) transport system ATP-binding protein
MADRIVVMNHGVVEQVGTPVEVYTRPRSRFVARFVGQMNFISATVCDEAGRVRVGDTVLRYPARAPLVPGTAVTLAVRPEEVVVGMAASPDPNQLRTRVLSVQFLGPFTRLHLTLPEVPGTILECDVAASAFADLQVAEGAELTLGLKSEALRVFPSEAS